MRHCRDKLERIQIGRVIRVPSSCWRGAVRIALWMEIVIEEGRRTFRNGVGEVCALSEEIKVLGNNYHAFESKVLEFGLNGVSDVKPVVNGNQMVELLNVTEGPIIGNILKEQIDLMRRVPGGEL